MTINETQDRIIEEFSIFDEWLDRYDYLIELSSELPPIAPEHRTEQYVIKGCQSRVWIDARLDEAGNMPLDGVDHWFTRVEAADEDAA